MYIQEATSKKFFNQEQIVEEFSTVAFKRPISDKLLEEMGILKIEPNVPQFNAETHKLVEKELLEKKSKIVGEETINYMQQNFDVVALTTEELAAKEVQRQKFIEQFERNAREKRNNLLRQSDWTQMPDSPLSEPKRLEWKTYRQTLRELPEQSGWPGTITWPQVPSN